MNKSSRNESGNSMGTIENLHAGIRARYCNRCAEPSCFQSPCFVPEQAVSTRSGIPPNRCPYIASLVNDDKLDIRLRIWIKEAVIEGKSMHYPFELTEIYKRQRAENTIPVRGVYDSKISP